MRHKRPTDESVGYGRMSLRDKAASEYRSELALQRRFEGFPFFEFFEAAFTVGLVGLMVAPGVILDQDQDVAGLAFGLGKTALH